MDESRNLNRRCRERVETDIAMTCRIPATPVRGRIRDLSHGGCRLTLEKGYAEIGATLTLETPQAGRLTGEVVWTDGRDVGVRFHRSLRKDLAIDWGVEAPEPVAIEVVAEEAPAATGLPHWIRRLSTLFR